MNFMHEELARVQVAARLGEAEQLRRARRMVVAQRAAARSEKAAARARLALARVL